LTEAFLVLATARISPRRAASYSAARRPLLLLLLLLLDWVPTVSR
jgi:hypothetical protein